MFNFTNVTGNGCTFLRLLARGAVSPTYSLPTFPLALLCAHRSRGCRPLAELWRRTWKPVLPQGPSWCPLPRRPTRAAEPDLRLAERAAWIPGDVWHRATISGKSHSPPGQRPRPPWHPKASVGSQAWRPQGRGRGAAWLVPRPASRLTRLPARTNLRSSCFPAGFLLGEGGRRKVKRKGKEEREVPTSGVWIRKELRSFSILPQNQH